MANSVSSIRNVGISDITVYIPTPKVELQALLKHRVSNDPKIERRFSRALDTTGQVSMRYPEPWQDNAALATQAAYELLQRTDPEKLKGLRYLTVGTETGVDHSKPVAAYVEGALQRAGLAVPTSLSTFQVQHACAGGTYAMLSIGALLQIAHRPGESGIVICSDIARYDVPSTAEFTQGAGAVAMLIEPNPRLLELDVATQGYSSKDVDDFFRPLDSLTAKVKGGYSVLCYHEALDAAFRDHCERLEKSPREVLESTDMFVFHVPFYKMAFLAAHTLLEAHLDRSPDEVEEFLKARGFHDSVEAAAQVGNIYSGAAYMTLAFHLAGNYARLGKDIVGQRVLICSYGSGNTMSVYSATVAERAPEVLESWDLPSVLSSADDRGLAPYEAWISGYPNRESYNAMVESAEIPTGCFYLKNIRDDGYREYEIR
ncbi:MAG: hydroxymethylglutaryl-CoA synthase [Spirochaetaceae bacterium]|nr:MAG: hydroxymethylglutaryl-CoA synthase [Spirochaetaceae bacterium]